MRAYSWLYLASLLTITSSLFNGLASSQVAYAESPPVLFAHSTIEMSDAPDCLNVRNTYYTQLEMNYNPNEEATSVDEEELEKRVEVFVENRCQHPVRFTGLSPSGDVIRFVSPDSFDGAESLTLPPVSEAPEEGQIRHRLRKDKDATIVYAQSLSFYRQVSEIEAEPTLTFTWELVMTEGATPVDQPERQGVIEISSTLEVGSYPCFALCDVHSLAPRSAPLWLIGLLCLLATYRSVYARASRS